MKKTNKDEKKMDGVALVTGANGGLGNATALKLGMNGFKVILNYHVDEDKAVEIASSIGTENTLLIEADITNVEAVNEMISKALEKFGRIDVLVNNAGITRDRTFAKMSRKEWDEVINVNLNGAFNVTKAVIGTMLKQGGGTIINISSIVGEVGNFGQTNYSASKAALIGFTKSLAKEVASKGITVNAIAPGFVDTEMTRKIPETIKSKILEQIPMRRFAAPEEIADVILFLCNATYITGTVIDVNGGLR
jgi:3-oxoacyl-(acyl-carrier-protein) reductase